METNNFDEIQHKKYIDFMNIWFVFSIILILVEIGYFFYWTFN